MLSPAVAAEAWLAAIVDSNDDAVIRMTTDCTVLSWNRGAERLYGYTAAEAVGASLEALIIPASRADEFRESRAAVVGGEQVHLETIRRRKDGQLLHMAIRVVPVVGDGRVVGCASIGRDVSNEYKSREALRAANRYNRSLIEATLDPLVIIGPTGKITDVNMATERITGRSRQSLIGSDFADYFTDPDRARAGYEKVFRDQAVVDHALEIRHRDGRVTPVLYNGTVYRDEAGAVLGVVGAARDVTALREAEVQLQRVNRALQALTATGQVLLRAPDEETLLRESARVIVSIAGYRMCWVGYARDDEEKTVEVVAAAGEGSEYAREIRVTWDTSPTGQGGCGVAIRTGRPSVVADIAHELRFSPWRDRAMAHGFGSVIGVPLCSGEKTLGALSIYAAEPNAFDGQEVRLLQDLANNFAYGVMSLRARHERSEAEKAFREAQLHLHEELEARVAARTRELEASNHELESFAYSVSHDLRAPLRAIDGFSGILLQECTERLQDEHIRYLRLVCENARHMGRLIDDLLRFSRLGRASLQLGMVDLDVLVGGCVDELKSEHEAREVEYRLLPLGCCTADESLMRQVFVNLLSNAVKFTRGRSPAVIEVGVLERDGERVWYVRDNGVGFDMAYADKLFGVFQRLHSQEEFEGTGIGLALVSRIVNRHGGRVWAEAAIDKGATFYLTLG